ncbi:hypothetical protein [Streptomyces sp. NBC_00557]|jgi:hypothetical protein|uniref:hypothetical protein n=1 Tax=Streptomyces sp. NBC_00557 TaxID=2975776 RepID=UPI002E80DE0F|nr:hypothetical protein [Streptomyces sp. NBC_00557]WUC34372.1 hypothetical protein OG956_09200 [Streptomyces sp. NBC_00557]
MSMPGTAPWSLPSTDVLALGGRRGRGGYHGGYHSSYHHYGSHGSGGGVGWWAVLLLVLVIVGLLIWNVQRDR